MLSTVRAFGIIWLISRRHINDILLLLHTKDFSSTHSIIDDCVRVLTGDTPRRPNLLLPILISLVKPVIGRNYSSALFSFSSRSLSWWRQLSLTWLRFNSRYIIYDASFDLGRLRTLPRIHLWVICEIRSFLNLVTVFFRPSTQRWLAKELRDNFHLRFMNFLFLEIKRSRWCNAPSGCKWAVILVSWSYRPIEVITFLRSSLPNDALLGEIRYFILVLILCWSIVGFICCTWGGLDSALQMWNEISAILTAMTIYRLPPLSCAHQRLILRRTLTKVLYMLFHFSILKI